MIALILACIAAFLALAVLGGVTARMPIGGPLVYGGCLVLSLTTHARRRSRPSPRPPPS